VIERLRKNLAFVKIVEAVRLPENVDESLQPKISVGERPDYWFKAMTDLEVSLLDYKKKEI